VRRTLAPLLLLALAVSGCGGATTTTTTTTRASVEPLSRSLALQLAAGADGVADALERGDPCAALQEAQKLREATVAAINAKLVPPDYQELLLSRVQDIEAAQSCPPPVDEDDNEDRGGKPDKRDKKKDKRGGKKH
jgi:hypothetical protein